MLLGAPFLLVGLGGGELTLHLGAAPFLDLGGLLDGGAGALLNARRAPFPEWPILGNKSRSQ